MFLAGWDNPLGMTSDKPMGKTATRSTSVSGGAPGVGRPEWANGLRQLYDSVVEEPIPDTFRDLLAQLDNKN